MYHMQRRNLSKDETENSFKGKGKEKKNDESLESPES